MRQQSRNPGFCSIWGEEKEYGWRVDNVSVCVLIIVININIIIIVWPFHVGEVAVDSSFRSRRSRWRRREQLRRLLKQVFRIFHHGASIYICCFFASFLLFFLLLACEATFQHKWNNKVVRFIFMKYKNSQGETQNLSDYQVGIRATMARQSLIQIIGLCTQWLIKTKYIPLMSMYRR